MKRILFAFATIALLLTSCAKDNGGIKPLEGEKVTYEFTPEFGSFGTRAMTENAQVKNLYVAVFDLAGYKLSEYTEAKLITNAGNNDVPYKYSVELTVSTTGRILHFIANAPKSIPYGSESEVIGSLCTSYNADDVTGFQESYWQRLELDCIPAQPGSDATAEQKAQYDEVVAALNGIKLIRNYSKVTLSKNSNVTNLQIEGMWLINYPDRGTVAPYNSNTGKFMSNYNSFSSVGALEGTEEGQGNYQGFMLATTQYLQPETFSVGENMLTPNGDGMISGFAYEREKALESPMYLLVKAKFRSSPSAEWEDCYYKIALQDGNGEFYAMLRNYNYLIRIDSVSAKGETTIEKALAGAPTGNISTNIEFQEITEISDGDSRLAVSATTLVLVGDPGETISCDDLWYRYIPQSGSQPYNGLWSESAATTPGVAYDFNHETGASGSVINGSVTVDAEDTGVNRYLHFSTTTISSSQKTQTITITGKYRGDNNQMRTITRKISLILRERLNMTLTCGPETDSHGYGHVSSQKNEKVQVNIGIEAGLNEAMFPLKFRIEAADRTLTPDGDVLPVESGTSTIEDTTDPNYGRPSFWYVKTIEWEEYDAAMPVDGRKYFTANFKSNVADNATEIFVSEKYFNQASTELLNYAAKHFTNVNLTPGSMEIGETGTFTFNLAEGIPASNKVTVGLANLEEVKTGGGYTSKLTYIGTKQEEIDDRTVIFELYEMPVSTASNSISVVAYQQGKAYAKVWADEYVADDSNTNVMSRFWSDVAIAFTPITPDNWTNTASGEPYAGQTFRTTLTATVPAGTTVSNAKVNGKTATTAQVTGTTLTITYQTSVGTTGVYDWPVTATLTYSGVPADFEHSTKLYVWQTGGLVRQSSPITSVSQLSEGAQIAITIHQDAHAGYYVYDTGSTLMNRQSGNGEDNMWKIVDINTTNSTCKLQNVSTGRYFRAQTANGSDSMTTGRSTNAATLTLSRGDWGGYCWQIQMINGSYTGYLNQYGGNTFYEIGYYGENANRDTGSRFQIYLYSISEYTRPTE